jgi:hypothetical protein
MFRIEEITSSDWPMAEINGRWYKAKPWPGPFTWRLRDAWAVLCGKADAVLWMSLQEKP